MKAQWENSRNVIERVVVTGTLTLLTPAHFGNGATGALADISLLRDAVDGEPLLPGASIAGAMRGYLLAYEKGYGEKEQKNGATLAEQLFGHTHDADEASIESWLFVDDAHGTAPSKGKTVEIRDGVAIRARNRTAEIDDNGKGKKFDVELLAAGTTFRVGFELWLPEENGSQLLEAFTLAFNGLKAGHIRLGMRKQRGYGQCEVPEFKVSRYRMDKPTDVLNWLDDKPNPGALPATNLAQASVALKIDATFILEKSSLLIRSDVGDADAPDMVHLRSWRNGKDEPILSGTSVAGALRSRCLRIAKTLMGARGDGFVDVMFGKRITESEDNPTGSLVRVNETVISAKNAITDRVQNRVKIDRFTGGAYPGALFAQQPIFGKDGGKTEVKICLELRKTPNTADVFDAQVGLLLMVLKDLWTGDLPLGGEQSVGRGRLSGKQAEITLGSDHWSLTGVPIPELEKFAAALILIKEATHA